MRTPDAPAVLDVPGARDGASINLRHESGITHTAIAEDGVVRPPLLIDGSWTVEAAGDRIGELLIGYGANTDGDIDGDTLLSCWIGTETVPPRSATPDGVRCTQTLVLKVALANGYPRAANLIETARRGLTEHAHLWGWYCGIAGDAAATGAVLGGADGRMLIRDEASFCDYSVLHGVGAASALLHASNPLPAVRDVCAADPLSDLPPIARTSQCWYGAGMGFARITRIDLLDGERLCMQAPEESSRLNCLEGFLSFARTYRLRGEEVRRNWPAIDIDGARCNTLPGSPGLLAMCYRSSAQMLIHDTAKTHTYSSEVRRIAVDAMLAICDASGERTSACWYGLGTLVATALHPDLQDTKEVGRWLNVCADAPATDAMLLCYERAAFGLLRNDQLVTGLDIDTILSLVPADLRAALRTKIVTWSQTLGGRSS